eukprot:GHVR01146856.1.p3 GENE.GHVR01146856.1~~GHVR01146856.1.p3  ORF type:complete len:116 (-),score=20.89 GHVR01146856.1:234-581(-)
MSVHLKHAVTDADMGDMYELGVTHGADEALDEAVAFLRHIGAHDIAAALLQDFAHPQGRRTVYMALFGDDSVHGPYDSIHSAHEAAEGWGAVTDIMPVTVRSGKFVRVGLWGNAE